MTKRYPFNMWKNGHNIEYIYNKLFIACQEMYQGEREWDEKLIERFDEISDVYSKSMGCEIYMATGKEYGILKEASIMADIYRDERRR